ncbi:hypothetical protein P170DRAFT_508190 [Aspergillus steynii IBT 23096]|uniref:Uncharacterized protein n=1 Tax=Aspergillus steynii IBT 23096 TaxID=1392250 RepID=A0A2I2GAI6_9EURO|nr:uncharacterized protein P170DRAFT_508190 [Aspergillus steynii IBT 23096]PLB49878.1 hypothetical protein P170DRAFT_508190 [Aspergillus steynii IBT 23096]
MTTTDEMMNEKTDLESPSQEPVNPDILNPLLFLLASRRGVRNDALFAEAAVPDDYILRFQGKSGVEAINIKPLWKRIVFSFGILSGKFFIVFAMFNFGYMLAQVIDHRSGDQEYNRSRLWAHMRAGAYAALLSIFLLLAAKQYAKRMIADATPPQYDPTSYQFRLVSAMEQRGIEYREVLPATPDDMGRYRQEEQALRERFRIVGLVDPGDAIHVYDLVVRFYNNGNIVLQFPAADPTAARSMVAMSVNASA